MFKIIYNKKKNKIEFLMYTNKKFYLIYNQIVCKILFVRKVGLYNKM